MVITRNDVARKANVSSATVSYVINDGPRPVSPATRDRVLVAIRELGYQPSAIARHLRLRRSFTIGLIFPDTSNPYFDEVMRGIEHAALENNYKVVLVHSGYDFQKELQHVDLLHIERVDGVIWIPATDHFEALERLNRYEIPTVIFDRGYSPNNAPTVSVDNFNGGYIATEHLIQLGHRRIGCIARPVELSHSQGRLEGYKAALKDYGIPFDPVLVAKGGFRLENGKQAFLDLLRLTIPPTALFAYNDIMAIGALRGAYETGLHVPDDFSIVGFDDIAQAAFTCPALTSVFQDKFEMGRRGAQLLLSLINKEPPDPDICSPVEVKLVVRESTGPAPFN
jgi:DNA-binding LacI/PurR family transcriptional regulator